MMTRKFYLSSRSFLGLATSAFLLFGSTLSSFAQKPQSRIAGEITSQRVVMPRSQPPIAKFAPDQGRLAPQTQLSGMSLVFSRSAAQEADLQTLIAAQQNPSSPQYHAWLTPDQFAVRFGMSDADIAKAETWLEQQGFTVEGVSRSRNRVTFSGTAAQAEAAFDVQLHNYQTDGTTHFAPAGDISLPAALAPVVQSVTHLSNFRPRSHMRVQRGSLVSRPNFTSAQTGSHFLTPADIETVYDIKAVHSQGITGSGQSIAIVGQSAVALSDIENFQSAAGLAKKDPTLVLVPNTGTSTVFTGDESESDLDLEYSGAIAPGATIYFVYAGNSTSASVTDAIRYAVDNDIAPIVSTSYGGCETQYSASEYATENGVLAQAAAQGQTVIAAAGDDGSTDCYGISGLTTVQQQAVGVDFPASSQYVTAMGGTEFSAANVASASSYWAAANGSDVLSSALSYIPEQVWNDSSSTGGISAGGGGASVLTTTRPSWQTSFPNMPSGTTRLVPDISLDSSPNNAGYIYCSSDFKATNITGSCANGFRDSSNSNLTVAGGTSFAVPIFAGMVAMVNQATGSAGQGVVNPTLYALASNSATYRSAFHDITTGNNSCTAGSKYCSTAATNTSIYAATTGYDEASGLGSIDFNNLLIAWKAAAPSGTSSLLATTTTVTSATATPASGASDAVTITVAPSTGAVTPAPTGTITVLVDGTAVSPAPTLSNGTASYTFSSSTNGSHVIRVTYSGDGTYAPSTNSVTVNVGPNFTIAATPSTITVAAGSTATSTITVTPVNGYTGTINWLLNAPSTLSACYTVGSASNTTVVSGGAPATATLTIFTSGSDCAGASLSPSASGAKRRFANSTAQIARGTAPAWPFSPGTGTGVALGGLLFCGLLGSRSRKLRLFLALGVISVATLSTFGCASNSSTTPTTPTTGNQSAAAGTYVLTLSGTDSVTGSTIASLPLNITLTVQ